MPAMPPILVADLFPAVTGLSPGHPEEGSTCPLDSSRPRRPDSQPAPARRGASAPRSDSPTPHCAVRSARASYGIRRLPEEERVQRGVPQELAYRVEHRVHSGTDLGA